MIFFFVSGLLVLMSTDTHACGRGKNYDDEKDKCVPKDYQQSFDAQTKDGRVNMQEFVASIKEDIEEW